MAFFGNVLVLLNKAHTIEELLVMEPRFFNEGIEFDLTLPLEAASCRPNFSLAAKDEVARGANASR